MEAFDIGALIIRIGLWGPLYLYIYTHIYIHTYIYFGFFKLQNSSGKYLGRYIRVS